MLPVHHRKKRPSSSAAFIPPFSSSPKVPKSSAAAAVCKETSTGGTRTEARAAAEPQAAAAIDTVASVLADAGCTLNNPAGPPCLPSDLHKFRGHLDSLLYPGNAASEHDADGRLRSRFLSAFSAYVASLDNFRRVLVPSGGDNLYCGSGQGASLVRNLLLVPSIQLDLQIMLLEKLPEYFDVNPQYCGMGPPSSSDIALLIISQFRWLDFLVDCDAFTEKLLEVLSICPVHLKKEIIGSLPEILGDQNNKAVVNCLERMLQEDSAIIVPVLDSLSNLNLEDQLHEQVITVAISCIRTIDGEQMPYLLRFLLLSASSRNARRIISRIRQQLKFFSLSNSHAVHQNKLKGKSPVDNLEASILDSLRSSLRYKSVISEETLKELKCLENPVDHEVIDIWLVVLIHMNGGSLQKTVETMFKKKVIDSCIQKGLFDQCVQGNKALIQDYFPSFLSLSAYLLACKEQKAREFGTHMYLRLFEELVDTYSRQEVLGALITHVGSGISFEVRSALDTMIVLASKYSQEMVQLSCHVNGILDFLEGFTIENLHRVYEVFSYLALWARCSSDSYGSSIANEFFMILRKQINSPDLKYKKMGLIGTLKIVSYLGDMNHASTSPSFQKMRSDEAQELLAACLESCKQVPLLLILFYDELVLVLESRTLQPTMMEWIGKHLGEFESKFLSDLESGALPVKESYCNLEGELWMNLDGDISPICLNILPLASSSLQSASLMRSLPANFLLLSVMEKLANQGSLGGIDALLGCPLYLPSSKYCFGSDWRVLAAKQKQIMCLSIYYATNWMRELLNAFCTQVKCQTTSQASKDEITVKVLKRLRNLVFLESLLNPLLKEFPLSLPELHLHPGSGSLSLDEPHCIDSLGKRNGHKETNSSHKNTKRIKLSKASISDVNGKYRQPMIVDKFKKVGSEACKDVPNEDCSSGPSSDDRSSESSVAHTCDPSLATSVEVSAVTKVLENQRLRFRPLSVDCLNILTFSKEADSCCPDPAAELPLHLYLLRDLSYKLEHFAPASKQCAASCLNAGPVLRKMTVNEFLMELRQLFPSLRKHLNSAIHNLSEGTELCQQHWNVQSAAAGNPYIPELFVSRSSVSVSVSRETLGCFRKMLNIPDLLTNKSVLTVLLEALQPLNVLPSFFTGIQSIPAAGSVGYLYCGAYLFLEEVMDLVCSSSFMLASELLLNLESLIVSSQKFFEMSQEENGKNMRGQYIQEVLPLLRNKLGTSARKLLFLKCNDDAFTNDLQSRGEMVRKILHIYLKDCDCSTDLLDELVQSLLPQVTSCESTSRKDSQGLPRLSAGEFVVWYRSLHEENIAMLEKLVKEVHKLRMGQNEAVESALIKLRKTVNVVVALVNMCKTHDKVAVHAMAVKYCGKFVDYFLKVFDFLQVNFEQHNDCIIHLVKELQKATRTVQYLCSEAKGLRRTIITRKIPATKRSIERFLFHVKSLLHTSSGRCTFWMGNLKHKDLMGQEVSSQAYIDQADYTIDDDNPPVETHVEDEPDSDAGEEDRGTL